MRSYDMNKMIHLVLLLSSIFVIIGTPQSALAIDGSTNPGQPEKSTAVETKSTEVVKAQPQKLPKIFLNYQFMRYEMNGTSTANTQIYKFGAATVDLNLLIGTWLYSSDWTFVAIVPQIRNKVETFYVPTLMGDNSKSTDTTSGMGDVRLMALTPVYIHQNYLVMLDVGMTLPTGSTDQYFTSNPTQRASYNMQLGSGTPDLVVGATLNHTAHQLTSSLRGQVTVRGGKNDHGYSLGNEFQSKISSMYGIGKYISAGAVGNYKIRAAVDGRDEKYEISNNFNAGSVAGDGHQYYHSAQANWDVGLNAKAQSPSYNGVNASLEVGVPVAQGFQNKDDIKLETEWNAAAAVNASF